MTDIKKLKVMPAVGIFFILVVTALCFLGCAGLGKPLEPPRIALANIQPQELKGFETVFEIHIRVFNTNDIALEVKGIECDLEINGENFATGISKTNVKIPAYGTEIVPVVLYSSVIHMFKGIYGLQRAEELSYRLEGKLRLAGGGYGPSTLPFQTEGKVSLNELTRQ